MAGRRAVLGRRVEPVGLEAEGGLECEVSGCIWLCVGVVLSEAFCASSECSEPAFGRADEAAVRDDGGISPRGLLMAAARRINFELC